MKRIDDAIADNDTAQAKTRNENLVPKNPYEQYSQLVNGIVLTVKSKQLQLLEQPDSVEIATDFKLLLTEDERSQLYEIATGLAGKYGTAVYSARVLLDTVIDLQGEDIESLRKGEQNIASSFYIHPNPASNFLTIHGLLKQGDVIELQNMLGILVSKIVLEADNYSVNFSLKEVNTGLYIVSIRSNNKQVFHQKVVVIR